MNQDSPHANTRDSAPTIVSDATTRRFKLGRVVATPGALVLLEKMGFSALALLGRHARADWGDCGEDDAALNDRAVVDGHRILSVFRLADAEKCNAMPLHKRRDLPTVWICTTAVDDEGCRESTVILLPSEN